jgi:hypothetical protein
MADLAIRRNDTVPAFVWIITDADGAPLDLTGATVSLTMRALTSNTPVTLTGTPSVTDPTNGVVQFAWSTADTSTAGLFQCEWHITLSGGGTYTYPNDGYLMVNVEEDLVTPGGATIVALGDVKDYLNIASSRREHDASLMRMIRGCDALVEQRVGPVLQRQHIELYDGGQYSIILRHRPVVSVQACVEWRGPIPYTLAQVQDPAHGTIYSVEVENGVIGRIVRRSAGGGVLAFPMVPQAIAVAYTSGRMTVPDNVRLATLEMIRENWTQTQQQKLARSAPSDVDDESIRGATPDVFMTPRVLSMLEPERRAPSVA